MGTKCKLSKHIKLIKELISNEIGLWLFMMAIIVIFPIIKIYDLHLFDNCEMNGFVDNITYSIIAAFIFYLFTVFYPKYKAYLKMYQNIYLNVSRIYDIMTSTFDLFGIDVNTIEEIPTRIEEIPKCFVEKKDTDGDNYTLSPMIARQLNFYIPRLLNMMIAFRSRYTDYLRPEALSNLDFIEDAAQLVSINIENEMSYEEVEQLYYQLFVVNKTTRALFEDYQQYR